MNLRQNIALTIGLLSVFTVMFFFVQKLIHRYYLNVGNNIAVAFVVLFVCYILTYINPRSRVLQIFRHWLSLRNLAIVMTTITLTGLVFFIVNNPFTGFLVYRKLVLLAVLSGIFFMLLECLISTDKNDEDDDRSRHGC